MLEKLKEKSNKELLVFYRHVLNHDCDYPNNSSEEVIEFLNSDLNVLDLEDIIYKKMKND